MKPALGLYEIEGYQIDNWIRTLETILYDYDHLDLDCPNVKEMLQELENLYPIKEID